MQEIVVEGRFRGPPHSGNGGYVAGLLARLAGGHRAVMMRAPTPLDRVLSFDGSEEPPRLMDGDTLVAQATAADPAVLPAVPSPPSVEEAMRAGAEYQSFHPICVCCGDQLDPAQGLLIRVGQLAGAPEGTLAGAWTVDAAFADEDGCVPEELVWAAIDCPGYYAWVRLDGRHGALTGTMQAEVLERPRAGDRCVVMAWPLERASERRVTSGVALFGDDGRLMARGLQTWIRIVRRPAA